MGSINLYGLSSLKVYNDSPKFNAYLLGGPNTVNPQFNGELNACLKLTKNGDTIFDVGANIGEYSHKLVTNFKNIRLHSFEPIPLICHVLESNIKNDKFISVNQFVDLNKNQLSLKNLTFQDKTLSVKNNLIKINNIALSNSNKYMVFFYYTKASSVSGLYHFSGFDRLINETPTQIKVKCESLDNYCQRNRINFINYLKVDTEGSDFDVLIGASNLIKNKKIKYIQFEYMEAYKSANATLKSLCKYLTSHGYSIFKIVPDGVVHMSKWRDELENYIYCNFLATPQVNSKWHLMKFN